MKLLKEYHEIFQEEAEKARAALEWEEKLNIIAYETDLGGKAAENYRKAVEKKQALSQNSRKPSGEATTMCLLSTESKGW